MITWIITCWLGLAPKQIFNCDEVWTNAEHQTLLCQKRATPRLLGTYETWGIFPAASCIAERKR